MFERFKKKTKPRNAFAGGKDEAAFARVVAWLKQASALVLDVAEDGNLRVFVQEDGTLFLQVYTDLAQRVPAYQKGEQFATIDFAALKTVFEQNPTLAYLWLNPHSDSVRINRTVFTPEWGLEDGVTVRIGLPADPPEALIALLKTTRESTPSLAYVYLALMENRGELSYAVTLASPEAKQIVAVLGPQINALGKQHLLAHPVDFVYSQMIVDDQYLID